MDAAENPPAAQKMLAFRKSKLLPEFFAAAFVIEIAFDLLFQRLQHARHRDQHGSALAMNGPDHLGRFECVLKYHPAAHQLRQEDSQKLSEDVAEWQQIQEADRMHPSFVLEIFSNLE